MNIEELLNKDKLVLVDFYASWCGPCKMIAPYIHEINEELKNDIYVIKIDVDQEEEIANKFGIYSIPTLVLIKDQKEIDRKMGYASKQIILDWVRKNL